MLPEHAKEEASTFDVVENLALTSVRAAPAMPSRVQERQQRSGDRSSEVADVSVYTLTSLCSWQRLDCASLPALLDPLCVLDSRPTQTKDSVHCATFFFFCTAGLDLTRACLLCIAVEVVFSDKNR